MTRTELLQVAKPILFNTDMVRAILEDRKTATRRLVKQNVDTIVNSKFHKKYPEIPDKQIIEKLCKPPFEKGDILYVRETWSEWTDGYVYKAWSSPFPQQGEASIMKWHPSIHMPREAARIFLKVKDVRVERLQDITEEQVIREGIHYDKCPDGFTWKSQTSMVNCYTSAKGAFEALWHSTINRDDFDKYGWDANPWVWVIEFERIEVE